MLVGGQAVLLHGRPRLTEDTDITLGVGPDELPATFPSATKQVRSHGLFQFSNAESGQTD